MSGPPREKILRLGELAGVLAEVRRDAKRVVHCHGVFDLMHIGHIRHLMAAKGLGDILVVTLTSDEHVNKGPGRPAFNQRLRAESLAALECVDYVAISETPTGIEAIRAIRPDVYAKGEEYETPANDLTGRIEDEAAAVAEAGGRIHFTKEITFSSTELVNAHFPVYPEAAETYLREFRRQYQASDVIGALSELERLRVLVVGDTIIDEYQYCSPLGKSQKDIFLVARSLSSEVFAGGVLAAANHVASFCGVVDVVTCLGSTDSWQDFVHEHLKPKIGQNIFYRPGVPTTLKRRFVEPTFLQKMFEVCYLDDSPLPPEVEDEVCARLEARLGDYDLVLVTDFGHGFVTKRIVDLLAQSGAFLAVNTQTNSANAGFNLITKYPRADYVCIDEPELRLAMTSQFDDVRTLACEIAERLQCPTLAITRGSRGSISYAREGGFFEVPVFSNKIVDTVGAGDAYLSVTAPCVATGLPMGLVGFIGNAVGALAVQILGNRSSVEPVPLLKFVTALLG